MKSNSQSVAVTVACLFAFSAGALAQDQVTHFSASNNSQVTLTSGQPGPDHYGPPPPFAQLDTNHDGSISREEAKAYIPLFNDFDHLAHHANQISKRQFDNWVSIQTR